MADDMITIDASALSSFDYSTYIYNYFSSDNVGTTKGASTYYGGTYQSPYGYYNGSEVGFRYTTDPANSAQVLLKGENIAYDGLVANAGHGISGTVDGFELGSFDANTTYTQDDTAGTRSELQGVIQGLVVSGLDYSAAVGTGTGEDNLVNTIYYALQKANTIVDLEGDGASGQEYVDQIYALLSQKAQHFIGSSGADNYTGTIHGDLIEGGAGADTLAGGAGDDTYIVTDANNVIVEAADGGNDTIRTALSHWQMADNVENLIQTGDAGQWSYGTATSNTMTANDHGGVLYGMGGGDTLNGGAGDDELHAVGFTDDGANDVLNGGAGNDLLDGGAGSDVITGGTGDDRYIVDSFADTVTENAGEGTDTIETGLSHYQIAANVENLLQTGDAGQFSYGNELGNTMTANEHGGVLLGLQGSDTLIGGAGNDQLFGNGDDEHEDGKADVMQGNAGNDQLTGGTGDDTLDGGIGADTMVGGAGNDSYVVDNKKDVVTEVDGGGNDKASASINYTLGDFVEKLVLAGTDDLKGSGNALDNVLNGNAGSNVLKGLDGDDTIRGAGGTDRIHGGLGLDRVEGGAGADAFSFKAGETGDTKKTADFVLDFSARQHDVLDLSSFDANDGKKGVQDFDFIGTDKFSHHAGELRYVTGADDTYIAGDTDGNGKADFMIHLGGALKVTDDFFHF
jgi:Ca2+-binding RTX toxin-like protein